MTAGEYAAYEASVEHNLKHLDFISTGACRGCKECGLDKLCDEWMLDMASEPFISKFPCEACGSMLGGNRHPAHARMKDDDSLVHLSICEDCLYYINYGQLDDERMMEIEKSQNESSKNSAV